MMFVLLCLQSQGELRDSLTPMSRCVWSWLASLDDKTNAFSSCVEGTVLGVGYNTVDWVWLIPEDNLLRILHLLDEGMTEEEWSQRQVKSLVGKPIDISCLVPGARFFLGELNYGCPERR